LTPDWIIVASCTVTLALLISYVFLYIIGKRLYIFIWILSLAVLFISYLSRILILETDIGHPDVFLIVNYVSTISGYWLIFKGTHIFCEKKYAVLWDIGGGLLMALFSLLTLLGLTTEAVLLASVVYTLALLVKTGLTCLNASRPKSPIKNMLGYTFFLWAMAILLYPLCIMLKVIPAWFGYIFIGVVGLIALISLQAVYFQRIKEELELKEANITRLVAYDNLTGAYNRAYFEQTSGAFYEKFALPVALAVGDINGLKLINDTFGHYKGDELLVDVVSIIKNTIGDENIIVRWGGDEFVIIMPSMTLIEAEGLMRKIKYNVRFFRPKTIPIDISFGLSVIFDRDQPIEEVIKQAEEKMYSSKLMESKKTRIDIIEFLEKILWEKDYQTEAHVMRLKNLVSKFGRHMRLSKREIVELTQVAMLHDIGKISVPTEILKKCGPLTEEEWSIMKKHSETGYRITQSSRELAHISEAILGHHEWWNGNGYPQGLKEEEIPLYSRIVSIVDSYDVMTHERPYKKAIHPYDAMAEINKCAGKQFDPYLVNVFIRVMQEALVVND